MRTFAFASALLFAFAFAPAARAAEGAARPEKAAGLSQAELEKGFEQSLSGSVFRGYFTERGKEQGGLKEEKYTITSVKKIPETDDLWVFNVRIQYGNHDATLPLTLPVKWAGDTPVISLTDMLVPGFGKFTARVVVYRGEYAGTWDGAGHGGHLFGKIEKLDDAKEDDAK
ncbi:MAG: hypothetical protein JNL96_07890 [Planctomycetaceae bacterium]|nr:hypothetical protein [Planctomycetaceae bacterium]